tara:strand:- start:227 stop:1687 length:1461 start_codon:yes stop_codon:yes gene_type:complete
MTVQGKDLSFLNLNEELKKVKILVLGDIILDSYCFGDARRLSPEAPVPILNFKHDENKLGGAANVAMNITSLGANCSLVGTIGLDREGEAIKDLCKKYNIETYLNEKKELRTINKTRIVSRNQQLLRMDFENYEDNKLRTLDFKIYYELIESHDLIIFSDYLKGTLPNCNEFIKIAKNLNKKILIDPNGINFEKYRGATLITPNYVEFENAVGKCFTEEEVLFKGSKLVENLNLGALLITRSQDGMTLIQKDKKPIHFGAKAKEVFDVTGAGDTVIATIGIMFSLGNSLKNSIEIANEAAGIVITKLGTTSLNSQEFLSIYPKVSKPNIECNLDELKNYISILKNKNKRIIMTNGCFDILHKGHISYLEQAKRLGDVLIIAINDDDSIKRLKGNFRPINNLKSRMQVLSGLRCVDFVISFNDDTPIKIYEELLPDVIVKGGDYHENDVIGGDLIKKNGGDVRIIELVKDISTTKIIEKIKLLNLDT